VFEFGFNWYANEAQISPVDAGCHRQVCMCRPRLEYEPGVPGATPFRRPSTPVIAIQTSILNCFGQVIGEYGLAAA
jgi:hypothetical protein